MFDSNNLYVLNKKDRNALVYRDSMGTISRLTRDMFSSDEEFEYWKKWSDEDYHDEEKERHIFADNTLYIDGMSEEAATADSPEDAFFFSLSESEKEELCNFFMVNYFSQLTHIQKRRMWLYFVEGKTVREIASLEGIAYRTVSETIEAGKTKFLRIFKKHPHKMPF